MHLTQQELTSRVIHLEQENQCLQAELTQLRQNYDRLRKSEARYRQVVQNAPISIQFIAADGRLLEANQAFETQFGVNFEQWRQNYNIFTDSQLLENGTLAYMQRSFAGEIVMEPITYYDTRERATDGRKSWNQGLYFPIKNEFGDIQEIVEMCLDRTELIAAQQALMQERARLLSTVATVANLLLKASDYTVVLPKVLQLLGEAARADRCSLIQNIIDPQSSKPAARMHTEWCCADIKSSLAHTSKLKSALPWELFPDGYKKLSEGETLCTLVDDLSEPIRSLMLERGNVSKLMVPIVVQGEFWGVFGFDYCREAKCPDEANRAIFAIAVDSIAAAIERQQQDEALRESEHRYRTLFELSHEGIIRVQFDHPISLALSVEDQVEQMYQLLQIVEANDAFATLYGWTKAEDAINSRLTHFQGVEANQHRAMLRALAQNGHQIHNAQTEVVDRTGQKRYILNNTICTIKDGAVVGGWSTNVDVTELKQAQEEVIAERVHTQAAILAERNRLACEIHDTLAQGLTGVIVQLQAAEDAQIQNSSAHQAHLQAARALAKECLAEARRSVWALRPQILENNTLSEAVTHLAERLTANKGIQLHATIQATPYALPPSVEDHLLRITQEALTNSLKHAHADTIWVALTFDTTQIRLRIQDNGNGFQPEQVATGFGLTSLRARAQMIQAQLTLTSQPGGGTTIVVVVPLDAARREEA